MRDRALGIFTATAECDSDVIERGGAPAPTAAYCLRRSGEKAETSPVHDDCISPKTTIDGQNWTAYGDPSDWLCGTALPHVVNSADCKRDSRAA